MKKILAVMLLITVGPSYASIPDSDPFCAPYYLEKLAKIQKKARPRKIAKATAAVTTGVAAGAGAVVAAGITGGAGAIAVTTIMGGPLAGISAGVAIQSIGEAFDRQWGLEAAYKLLIEDVKISEEQLNKEGFKWNFVSYVKGNLHYEVARERILAMSTDESFCPYSYGKYRPITIDRIKNSLLTSLDTSAVAQTIKTVPGIEESLRILVRGHNESSGVLDIKEQVQREHGVTCKGDSFTYMFPDFSRTIIYSAKCSGDENLKLKIVSKYSGDPVTGYTFRIKRYSIKF